MTLDVAYVYAVGCLCVLMRWDISECLNVEICVCVCVCAHLCGGAV